MSNEHSVKPVELLASEPHQNTIAVRIDTSAPIRTIERQLRRVLKPFKICPKNKSVRAAVALMLNDPDLSPAEASRRVCNTARLERQIRYWSDKLISVGGAR
jgi:hypothetical protein